MDSFLLYPILVIFGLGVFAVIYGSFAKNNWGINFNPPKACPKCSGPIPRGLRVPKDQTEALWGGFTCPSCGCKMDKWGRVRQDS